MSNDLHSPPVSVTSRNMSSPSLSTSFASAGGAGGGNKVYERAAAAADGFGHLHYHIGPQNVEELKAIHSRAGPSATFYVTAIFCLYLLGLAVILVHYMNSYYGSWNWTLDDIWVEVKPMFVSCFRKKEGGQQQQQQPPTARTDKSATNDPSEVSSDGEESINSPVRRNSRHKDNQGPHHL